MSPLPRGGVAGSHLSRWAQEEATPLAVGAPPHYTSVPLAEVAPHGFSGHLSETARGSLEFASIRVLKQVISVL